VASKSAAALVDIEDNDMQDLRYHGIALTQSTKATLRRNQITNVDFNLLSFHCVVHAALCMTGSSQVLARDNLFVGSHMGVSLIADGSTAARIFDFGHTGDNGGNVFACNSRSQTDAGHDFQTNLQGNSDAVYPIQLVGNSWDHVPPTQGNADGVDISSIE